MNFWIRLGFACLCFIATLCGLPAPAQDATPTLIPRGQPYTAYAAGTNGTLWLYYLNESTHDVTWRFPAMLEGTLIRGSTNVPVSLALPDGASSSAIVRPRGFVKQEYRFEFPRNMIGDVWLSVSNYPAVLVRVEMSNLEASNPESAPAKKASEAKQTKSAGFFQYLGEHLSPYEPIFFLLGTYPAAEFQFSLKYKVFNTEGPVNPLAHFYFAYTQTSFWDLLTRDPSFFDTSYKPSMFLLYSNVPVHAPFQLDLQGGAEHESNGRGGTGERSLYTAYLQPTAHLDLSDRWQFAVQPRAWAYLSVGANNDDLAAYRGYADLRTSLTWFYGEERKRIQLANQFRIGDSGRHPGLLIDLRIDLPAWARLNPTVQLQYFTGYGQTLRQYNEYSHGFRAGLCLHY